MADSYTGFLNLTKPEVGGSRDSWGAKIDANFDLIDAWAKATDALATDALPRTRLNKDVNGATIPWAVAPDVNFTGALSVAGIAASGNYVGAKGKFIGVGGSRLNDALDASSNPSFTDIQTNTANWFRVVNNTYDTVLLSINTAGGSINGKGIWTAANLVSPLDRAVATVQSLAGDIQVSKVVPRYSWNHPSVRAWAATVETDGFLSIFDTTGGARRAYFGTDGSLWLSQFGDLNTRIETRAAFFADDRLASAKAYTNSYTATNYVNKAGDTMTGSLAVSFANPYFDLTYPGTIRMRQTVDGNGSWILRNGDAGNNFAYITTGGAMWLAQFGDLSTRIDTRAASFADDRLNTAKAYTNSYSLPKTGGTLSGDLFVDKGTPGFQLTNRDTNGFGYIDFCHTPYGHGDFTWRLRHSPGDNQMYLEYLDNGVRFAVRTDGSGWLAQFGDINTRIETRAASFADDRLNTATARINNKSARLAFLGDVNVGSSGRTMVEPYGGAVITGFAQNNGAGYSTDFRFRQLQMSDSNANWYACGYV